MKHRYLKCLAFHEAGHAVAAHAIGAEVEAAWIRTDRGRVTYSSLGCPGASIEEDFRIALLLLAGPCAERMVTRRSWADVALGRFLHADDGGHDLVRVQKHVDWDEAWNIFRPMAQRLVSERRGAVRALAAHLLKGKPLSGRRVHAILDRADPTLYWSIRSVRDLVPPDTAGHKPLAAG